MILTAKFLGANPNPEIVAEGQMEYKCNYFLGNDPSKWHTDVPNYEAITLKDIYPGIDLKYSGDGNGQAAYEFLVAPGADVAQIKVEYEGAEETSINADGRLVLKTQWGDMIASLKTPADGARTGSCAWWTSSSTTSPQDLAHGDVRQARQVVGFEADRSTRLTTDGSSRQALGTLSVALAYSTYLGGGNDDWGYGIAVDGNGNAYVTGWTWSSDFPTLNPYQTTLQGDFDVFVTKLSNSGNSLIYSTYLGGSGAEYDYGGEGGIAVDGSGNAYVTGFTYSSDFPIEDPFQTYQGGHDVFVTKLSSSGNSLIYSTYLGGGGDDYGKGIAVNGSGYAYVTGCTISSDFPTLNPYQTTHQSRHYDVFVTKLSSTGNSLIYSTYLGGGDWDEGLGIAVDGSGNAYVTGWTVSSDFPILNPYQGTYQGDYGDAFVTKLSNPGNSLIYSTYLGGSGAENEYGIGGGIAVDGSGYAYVRGYTYSSDFPTENPYQTYQGDADVFVTKLSSSGNSLIYSTYLGGGSRDVGFGIAIDNSGNAYVTGYTYSSDFPTLNPYQADQGSYDAFVTKLSSTGNSLIYSTYLGGGDDDGGLGIAVDGSGNAYVAGYTHSSDFPTLNPYQTDQGGLDVFVTKFGGLPHDASVRRIVVPDSSVSYLSTLNPQALVCNEGENAETVPVIFQIGSAYSDTGEVTLAPGDSSVVTFANWNANTVGSFNITCFTALETDNYRGNDTLKSVVTIVADTMAPVIYSIAPNRGGNTGSLTVTVAGDQFQSGARTKLTRAGETEITADSAMTLVIDSTTIIATFDLRDHTVGFWDVVVTNPDSRSTIFHDVFRIEDGNERVWCDVIGPSSFRPERTGTVWVSFGNSGNVDVNDYLLRITIPASVQCQLDSSDFLLPVGSQVSWDSIPAGGIAGTELIIPVWLVRMVPGFADVINLKITVPGGYPGQVFPLLAEIGTMMPSTEFSATGNLAVLATATGFNHLVDVTLNSWPTLPVPDRVDVVAAYLAEFEQFRGGLRSIFDQRRIAGLENVNQEPNLPRIYLEEGGKTAVTAIAATAGKSIGGVTGFIFQLCDGVASLFEGVMMITQHYKRYEPWLAMARDPNDKMGPIGFDTLYAYVSPDETVNYVIYFENDSAATADAENIWIADTLDADLEWSTFSFGEVFPGAGPNSIRPNFTYATNFDPATGVISWTLNNINLPPDTMPYWGEGWVSYTIRPKPDLPSGRRIENIAAIKFDENPWILAPMDSLPIFNTIDAGTPTSSVSALPDTTRGQHFTVHWSGSDEPSGSGIASYSIYVKTDAGGYELWKDTAATSGLFTGVVGHTYAFYSVARDNVGHVESIPLTYDARTTVTYACGDANADAAVDISDVVYLIAYIFSGGSAPSPLFAGDANCDAAVDISDVVYLISHIFSGGAAPCAGCK